MYVFLGKTEKKSLKTVFGCVNSLKCKLFMTCSYLDEKSRSYEWEKWDI